eukprot:318419_1
MLIDHNCNTIKMMNIIIFIYYLMTLSTSTILFQDDMASNNTINTNWEVKTGDIIFATSLSTSCPSNPLPCTELRGNNLGYSNMTSTQISTVNYQNISLKYDIRVELLEMQEACYVDYSINGLNWINLD